MSSASNTIENAFQNVGNDIRHRVADIATKVRSEARDATDAVCNTLEKQREFATEALGKAGKKTTHLIRRYPIPILASVVAVGFVIGRIRR